MCFWSFFDFLMLGAEYRVGYAVNIVINCYNIASGVEVRHSMGGGGHCI